MALIKGISVLLVEKTLSGKDEFNREVYEKKLVKVDNVLVGEPSTDEVANELNMSGKKIAYTLAIPKGDVHIWEDTEVILPDPFKGRYRTIGKPTAGIEDNIPLCWNKKVKVECYEQ